MLPVGLTLGVPVGVLVGVPAERVGSGLGRGGGIGRGRGRAEEWAGGVDGEGKRMPVRGRPDPTEGRTSAPQTSRRRHISRHRGPTTSPGPIPYACLPPRLGCAFRPWGLLHAHATAISRTRQPSTSASVPPPAGEPALWGLRSQPGWPTSSDRPQCPAGTTR